MNITTFVSETRKFNESVGECTGLASKYQSKLNEALELLEKLQRAANSYLKETRTFTDGCGCCSSQNAYEVNEYKILREIAK